MNKFSRVIVIVLCILIPASFSSCGFKEQIPKSTVDKPVTIKVERVDGEFSNSKLLVSLTHMESGQTYKLVFNEKNNYTRTVLIPTGTYCPVTIDTEHEQTKGALWYAKELPVEDSENGETEIREFISNSVAITNDEVNYLKVYTYYVPASFSQVVRNDWPFLVMITGGCIFLLIIRWKKRRGGRA